MKWHGLKVIDGSGFQYYEPGWTKGYYSSTYTKQDIEKQSDGSITVRFGSAARGASGLLTIRSIESKIHMDAAFQWHGDHPARIENCLGIVRKVFFLSGSPEGGIPQPLAAQSGEGIWPGTGKLALSGKLLSVELSSSNPFDALDGAKTTEDWGANGGNIWLGQGELSIDPGQVIRVSADWNFNPQPIESADAQEFTPKWISRLAPKEVGPILPNYNENSVKWRGIHLFVGPHALAFHKRLIERVLKPLGFNYVVLQCERTNWAATPGVQTSITMSKTDLVKLFNLYRRNGIEPIPLIESFGHMPWLFENGKNQELAYNPQEPYAIDPRKPEAKAMIERIWDEVINLLHPKTIHFGLDEVDLRGFPENDAAEVTELWRMQVPFLLQIAQKHHVNAMLWGDKMLAPGEAPDACLGDSPEEAAKRREILPPDTIIADWHYKADANPQVFSSLNLWRKLGMRPIASEWYRPENIAGFTKAAQDVKAGTLLTTWAGYESSEEAMLADPKQFSIVTYAAEANANADAALQDLKENGTENISDQARRTFQFLFYGPSEEGGWGKDSDIQPVMLQGLGSPQSPTSARFNVNAQKAKAILIGLSCEPTATENELVGSVEIEYTDGSKGTKDFAYGLDLTSNNGPAPFRSGGGLLRIETNGKEVRLVRVQEDAPYGLAIRSLRISKS